MRIYLSHRRPNSNARLTLSICARSPEPLHAKYEVVDGSVIYILHEISNNVVFVTTGFQVPIKRKVGKKKG